MSAYRLDSQPIHLGSGATAVAQPEFTGMEWYAGYIERHGAEGADGRLVSLYSFAQDWDMWEMHPAGEEVVVCIAGAMVLHQEFPDGTTAQVPLAAGEYAINPRGTWHTADIAEPATGLFITSGLGTEHRPR